LPVHWYLNTQIDSKRKFNFNNFIYPEIVWAEAIKNLKKGKYFLAVMAREGQNIGRKKPFM